MGSSEARCCSSQRKHDQIWLAGQGKRSHSPPVFTGSGACGTVHGQHISFAAHRSANGIPISIRRLPEMTVTSGPSPDTWQRHLMHMLINAPVESANRGLGRPRTRVSAATGGGRAGRLEQGIRRGSDGSDPASRRSAVGPCTRDWEDWVPAGTQCLHRIGLQRNPGQPASLWKGRCCSPCCGISW